MSKPSPVVEGLSDVEKYLDELFKTVPGSGAIAARQHGVIYMKLSSTVTMGAWTPGRPVTVVNYFRASAGALGGVVIAKQNITVANFLALGLGTVMPNVIWDGNTSTAGFQIADVGFEVSKDETVFVNIVGGGSAAHVNLSFLEA